MHGYNFPQMLRPDRLIWPVLLLANDFILYSHSFASSKIELYEKHTLFNSGDPGYRMVAWVFCLQRRWVDSRVDCTGDNFPGIRLNEKDLEFAS